MSRDYWLGVITTPVLVAALFLGFVIWVRSVAWLERHGWKFGLKWRRAVEEISDYLLSHNIWWERSWGPVFAGGWYREVPQRRFNRWVGLGSPNGPCFVVYRIRFFEERT